MSGHHCTQCRGRGWLGTPGTSSSRRCPGDTGGVPINPIASPLLETPHSENTRSDTVLEHSDGDFARQMMTSFGDEKRVGEGVDAWHSDALSAIDELAELGVRLPNADHIRSVLANPLRNQFIADAAKESEMSITTYLAAVSKHIEQILQEGVFCINIGGKENRSKCW